MRKIKFDESGQGLCEYALIPAFIVALIALVETFDPGLALQLLQWACGLFG